MLSKTTNFVYIFRGLPYAPVLHYYQTTRHALHTHTYICMSSFSRNTQCYCTPVSRAHCWDKPQRSQQRSVSYTYRLWGQAGKSENLVGLGRPYPTRHTWSEQLSSSNSGDQQKPRWRPQLTCNTYLHTQQLVCTANIPGGNTD